MAWLCGYPTLSAKQTKGLAGFRRALLVYWFELCFLDAGVKNGVGVILCQNMWGRSCLQPMAFKSVGARFHPVITAPYASSHRQVELGEGKPNCRNDDVQDNLRLCVIAALTIQEIQAKGPADDQSCPQNPFFVIPFRFHTYILLSVALHVSLRGRRTRRGSSAITWFQGSHAESYCLIKVGKA